MQVKNFSNKVISIVVDNTRHQFSASEVKSFNDSLFDKVDAQVRIFYPELKIISLSDEQATAIAGSASFHSGTTLPDASVGDEGDFYINSSNGDFFKKVDGAWSGVLGNLRGPVGATGATGAQGPQGIQGVKGDQGLQGLSGNLNAFASTVLTGTGASQSILHGLGAIPTKVLVSVYDTTGSSSFVVVEGVHTATEIVVTVTLNVKFKVLAIL